MISETITYSLQCGGSDDTTEHRVITDTDIFDLTRLATPSEGWMVGAHECFNPNHRPNVPTEEAANIKLSGCPAVPSNE